MSRAFRQAVLTRPAAASGGPTIVSSGTVPGNIDYGSVTQAHIASWLGVDSSTIQDASGNGYGRIRFDTATNSMTVKVPANTQDGCQIWINVPAVPEMWVGAKIKVPANHDFVKAGKFFLGCATNPTPGGSVNYTNGATLRVQWFDADVSTPKIQLYWYPPRTGTAFGNATNSTYVIPLDTEFHMAVGMSKTTDTMEIWINGVQVVTQSTDLSAANDFTRGIIQIYYGGNDSTYESSKDEFQTIRDFKMAETRAAVT